MKTERRHELGTNELADSLSHWIESVKPYTRAITGLTVLVLVLIFAYGFVSRHSASKAQAGWDEYFLALAEGPTGQQKLEDVAEKYPGTPVGRWAKLTVGDYDLADGTRLLFTDKAVAREKLLSAAGNYQDVLNASREATLEQRALFGSARTNESLGEIEKARDQYQELAKRWPGSPFALASAQRATDLSRTETKQFYDWFAKQEPAKRSSTLPGIPGMPPEFKLDSLNNDEPPQTGPGLPQQGDDSSALPSAAGDDGAPLTSEPGGEPDSGSPPADGAPPAAGDGGSAPTK